MVNPSLSGTWEPGVEGVKGACKGEEGLVEGMISLALAGPSCNVFHYTILTFKKPTQQPDYTVDFVCFGSRGTVRFFYFAT